MAKKRKNQRKKKKKGFFSRKNSLLYVIAFIGVALLASSLIEETRNSELVPYSQVKTAIKEDSIERILIGKDLIEAIPTDATAKKLFTLKGQISDDSLIPLLEEKKIQYEARKEATWLGDFFTSWILPLIFIYFLWQFLFKKMFKSGGPPGLMAFGKNNAKLVDINRKDKVTFSNVAGCGEVKEELQEIISFLKKPKAYLDIGGRIPKGVLLVGPPGTGKTLLARAVAGEANVSFFQISGSDFVEMFVGVGAARVRDLFTQASKKSPCIIFIDELDAIAKSRSSNAYSSNDERENTLNQILVEMDGFSNHSGVIIMAATNRPEVLDPAILRPGRFDRQIIVDRPGLKERKEILGLHLKKVKHEKTIDLDKLSSRTPYFTGADLENVINESALLAVRRESKIVQTQDIEEAIDRVMAGLEKKSRTLIEDEKERVAIHEVGHALVAHFSDEADSVHRISIVPRSKGALGYTMQVPNEERHLMTKEKLFGQIRTLLGGRAAEEVVLGNVSTGAHDDLKRASQMIRRMICEFGMSDSLGLISLGQSSESYAGNPFIQNEYAPISEELAQKADQELKSILESKYMEAKNILREKSSLMQETVALLLKKEVIESEEIKNLFNEKKVESTSFTEEITPSANA